MYQAQWQSAAASSSSASWGHGDPNTGFSSAYDQQQHLDRHQQQQQQQPPFQYTGFPPGSEAEQQGSSGSAHMGSGSNNTLSGAFGGLDPSTDPSFGAQDTGMLPLPPYVFQQHHPHEGGRAPSQGGTVPDDHQQQQQAPYGYSQDTALMGMSDDGQPIEDHSAFAAFSQPKLDNDEAAEGESGRQTQSGNSSSTASRSYTTDMARIQSDNLVYPNSASSGSIDDLVLQRTHASLQQQQHGHPVGSIFYGDQGQQAMMPPDNGGGPWNGQAHGTGSDNGQASILQRPNKPSALNLDKSQSAFNLTSAGHPSDKSNGSGYGGLGSGVASYADMPDSALSQGSMLTPQNARFVSIPQLPPSLREHAPQMDQQHQQQQQQLGDHAGPSDLMSAFGSDAGTSNSGSYGGSGGGFAYTGHPQFARGEGGGGSRMASGSDGIDVKVEGDPMAMMQHRPAMMRLEIPPSPGSPLHAQLTGQFSPSSTLSGAFSSRPSSRPGSQGLKSVASFTSSLGATEAAAPGDNGGSHSINNGGRPRSGSSDHAIVRPTMTLNRTVSMSNEVNLSPSSTSSVGPLAQSRSVPSLASPSQNVQNSLGQTFDPTWGAASRHLASLQGVGGGPGHPQQPFQSPDAASPAQSQYSPQTYFGQQPSGIPYFTPSMDGSHRFGSSGSLASDSLDVGGFNEQRLSAALASGAHISSGGPHAHRDNRDGHSTPTIMEEEEDGLPMDRELIMPEAQLRSAPSQTQLAHLEVAQQQHQQQQQQALLHRSRSGPITSGSTETSPFQQPVPFQPNMRPSLYQQISLTELNQLRQMQGLASAEQNIGDCSSFIQDIIRQYITTMSRLGLGERNVLIMTTKVAQKSYGAEKRFLCPPPMVLLIGSSWWNVCPDASRPPPFQLQGAQGEMDQVPTVLSPPRLTINISGEPGIQDGALEWASNSGKLIDVGNPSSDMAISGRCIGKQLYISDIDEKRRHVEAFVSISVPGASPLDRRLLGTFASKPIKVISKPSKKRQSSRNTELCVNHGSVISLFHRLRSQTVSTRYLCVSGAPSWFKGSDNQPFLNMNPREIKGQENPSCFVAKMSSWDPFIIYLVDPKKRADTAPSATAAQPPVKGYPPPPPNALPTSGLTSSQMTVHYNQPIVLQCLNTAVVSPVMVIRKVEKGTTVLGGRSAGGPHFSREAFGDPVSQLHKIALEALEDLTAAVPRPTGDSGENLTPGQGGPFLACLNESVGMHRPSEGRKWIANNFSVPSTPTTPITPMNLAASEVEAAKHLSSFPTSPTSMAAAYAAAQTRYSMSGGRGSFLSPGGTAQPVASNAAPPPSSSSLAAAALADAAAASNDGGKVKRPRRVSSSVVMQKERAASANKNRKRGQSLSVVGMQNQAQNEHDSGRRTSSCAHSLTASDSSAAGSVAPGAMWSVEVADSDIWTIVGTDIARHSFYVPPRIVGGSQPTASVADSSISHLITVPAPSQPITPIPLLHNVVPPPVRPGAGGAAPSPSDQSTGTVTLFGENFNSNLFVYFGDWKSEHVDVRSRGTIVCAAPPSLEYGVPRGQVPILLVRHDGIIFPTDLHYQC